MNFDLSKSQHVREKLKVENTYQSYVSFSHFLSTVSSPTYPKFASNKVIISLRKLFQGKRELDFLKSFLSFYINF